MKTALAAIMLLTAVPANAFESIGDRSNRQAYESVGGYAYEHNCYRYEYREEYVPGTSRSPGYVRSYREKIAVPCYYNGGGGMLQESTELHHLMVMSVVKEQSLEESQEEVQVQHYHKETVVGGQYLWELSVDL